MTAVLSTIDVDLAGSDAGGWTAVASTGSLDRDGERVDPYALTIPKGRLPVHLDHNWSVGSLAGSCTAYYDSMGRLLVDGVFSATESGQKARQLIREGHLSAMSIGFLTTKKSPDTDGVMHITNGELVEVSFVTIGSNRDAQIVSVRSPRTVRHDLTLARALVVIAEANAWLATTTRGYRGDETRRHLRSLLTDKD